MVAEAVKRPAQKILERQSPAGHPGPPRTGGHPQLTPEVTRAVELRSPSLIHSRRT